MVALSQIPAMMAATPQDMTETILTEVDWDNEKDQEHGDIYILRSGYFDIIPSANYRMCVCSLQLFIHLFMCSFIYLGFYSTLPCKQAQGRPQSLIKTDKNTD